MIYEIDNKYYIKISPLNYKEINMELVNDDIKIVTTNNVIEANSETIIKNINFQQEKNNFKQLLQYKNTINENRIDTRKYKKRK